MMSIRRGFTLIELLIVVAIIAILAAIAVPNFLEAQTRAKVSRVKSDMRSMATALESYRIDWNLYPYDGYNYNMATANQDRYEYWYLPLELSTPVAYFTSVSLVDPFRSVVNPGNQHFQYMDVRYIGTDSTWGTPYDSIQTTAPGSSTQLGNVRTEWGGWRLNSAGPDRTYGPTGSTTPAGTWPGISAYPDCPVPYDATNGTTSRGDIQRSQTAPNGYVNTP